jgi:SSS family solute:Na+ symporter
MGSLYGIGLALGMLGLGCGYAARLRSLGVGTLPELLEKKYQDGRLQKVAGLLSVISLAGILLCQAIGLKKFLCSIGYAQDWVYVAFWGIVVLYTTCGGFLAVVWTDVVQAVVMVAMLGITFFCAFLPKWPEIVSQATQMGCGFDGATLASLVIPLCFIFVEQDMAQRCFAAKTPRDATIGCLAAAVVLIVLSGIPTICGILGRQLNLSPNDGAIFMQVVKQISSPFVCVMAASAVLLAIISTASALLLALSSNVAQDMKLSFSNGRLVTFGLGFLALLGPYIGNDIITWMVGSYEVSVGALFVPIMFAVFSKRECLPASAAWMSVSLGILGTLCSWGYSSSLFAVFLPFVFSSLGLIAGLKLSRANAVANSARGLTGL